MAPKLLSPAIPCSAALPDLPRPVTHYVLRREPSRVYLSAVSRALYTDAALTNMRLAARSASEPGPQLVYTLPNYTYSTTRSPGVPVTLTKDLVLQLNYVVDTPIDS